MKQTTTDELPYIADATDVLISLPGIVISEISLSPGQSVPWHYHSQVTDRFYALKGCTLIRHGTGDRVTLEPGESFTVPSGMPHQVEAVGDRPCRFLIIQGIGEYDFIPVEKAAG